MDLAKYYGLRQKMIATLTSMTKDYYPNLNTDASTFDSYLNIVMYRISLLSNYNEKTIKLLISQELDYDFDTVTVPDLPSGNWNVMFSHAILIVNIFIYLIHSLLIPLPVLLIMDFIIMLIIVLLFLILLLVLEFQVF